MQKPKCKALHKAQEALLASDTCTRCNDPPSPQPSTPSPIPHPFDDVDMDAPPIPFEGDYFGDYPSEIFRAEAGDDQLNSGPLLSNSESDSDSDEEPKVESWEPVLCMHPVDSAQAPAGEPATNSSSDDVHAESNASAAADARQAIEANTTCKTFVMRYLSSRAGAPIPKSKSHASTNETYGATLDPEGLDAANPYAPFTSKLDWEIAHWAKLYGPGSTAFTNLLAIEEVCKK